MRRYFWPIAAVVALAISPALAQGAGGGAGATATGPGTAACTAPGEDGKPSRKLSSEEVCPMYAFWRDDCTRAGRLGNVAALEHCGPAAIGQPSDRLVTGSIRPTR